jgi:hypothetical protein
MMQKLLHILHDTLSCQFGVNSRNICESRNELINELFNLRKFRFENIFLRQLNFRINL